MEQTQGACGIGLYLYRNRSFTARQKGKTTLVKAAFPSHEYVSLEETDMRMFVRDDTRGFLDRYPGPVIIDEAQRAPDLFSSLQAAADRDAAPGRFILAGSQHFLLMEKVSQSLAGRTGHEIDLLLDDGGETFSR